MAYPEQLALRAVPMPADENAAGDIFGGWLLARADQAASLIAAGHARTRVVTVAVQEFQFRRPVRPGDVVSFYGHIHRVGTSSMTIALRITIQRLPAPEQEEAVASGSFVCVALDPAGRPAPVGQP